MSGYLAGQVWRSDLDPELKPLAAAIADGANDNGTGIFGSVDYYAWLLGRSSRTVEMGRRRLRDAGVLVVVKPGGGRRKTTEFRMLAQALPMRRSWQEHKYGKRESDSPKHVSGYSRPNPEGLARKFRNWSQISVKSASPRNVTRDLGRNWHNGKTRRRAPISNALDFWKQVMKSVQVRSNNNWAKYAPWLEATRLLDFKAGCLVIGVPHQEFADWILENAKFMLIESVRAAGEEVRDLVFEVTDPNAG